MTRQILFMAVSASLFSFTYAGEGSRISHEVVAIGSIPLGDRGEDNGRFFRASGLDHFELNSLEPIGAYSLTNFSFAPLDLGLASVEDIVSTEVSFTTVVDARHDATEEIKLFYTPDTRRDLGVTLEDQGGYNLTYDDSVVHGIEFSQFKVAPFHWANLISNSLPASPCE